MSKINAPLGIRTGRASTVSFLPEGGGLKNANTAKQMRRVADYISDNA